MISKFAVLFSPYIFFFFVDLGISKIVFVGFRREIRQIECSIDRLYSEVCYIILSVFLGVRKFSQCKLID